MTGLKAGVIGGGWFGEIHCNVVAVAALAAGKHVLLEKPIASTGADARRMIQSASDHGRILAVGHTERFNPAVRQLKETLEG